MGKVNTMTIERRMTIEQRFINYLNDTDDYRKDFVRDNHKIHGVAVARKPRDIWGSVQETFSMGTGTKWVFCTGHGGILTSYARNMTIDEELRHYGVFNDGRGMYEEDCDSMIYFAYYPDSAVKFNQKYFKDIETARSLAVQAIMRYYHDQVKNLLVKVGY